MTTAARAITSARLTFRIHRFEVLAATIGLLLLAGAAVWVKAQLDGTGVTRECLETWLGTAGEPAAACVDPVQRWADIVNDPASKVMGAMLFVPLVAGLLLGVPLVGREIEQRTAATAWALAGSRSRWLAGRLAPVLVLVIALGVVLSVVSAMLQAARSVDGIWQTSLIGRTLPALIIGAVATLVALFVVMSFQQSWQSRSPLYDSDFGASTDDDRVDLLDPAWEYRFSTPGGRYLSRDEALATVPPGAADVQRWLRDNYEPEFRGPSDSVAREWQATETIGVLVAAGVLMLVAFPIVERRRPG